MQQPEADLDGNQNSGPIHPFVSDHNRTFNAASVMSRTGLMTFSAIKKTDTGFCGIKDTSTNATVVRKPLNKPVLN
jgi:hypothetical protein